MGFVSRQEGINKAILRITLPAIVSNITTPVLGLVDVAIAGHIGAASYIGAIAVGGTMFNMLYWLFAFLRMGTAGLTSQAYGASDAVAQSANLRRSLAISAVLGVVLVVISPLLAVPLLGFIGADPHTAPLAMRYFNICVWGAPAVLGMYVLNGWWLGMQDTRTPMWVSLGINLTNIAVSLWLVFGLGWRIEGVATGTLTAQWAGFVAGLAVTAYRFRPVRVSAVTLWQWQAFRRLFSVNADIFLRTLCLVGVTVWFTRSGASQGAVVLAANALLMQFVRLFSYFSDGFAFAGEALAGRFYGAGDNDGLHRAVSSILRWGWGIAVVFTVVYFVGGGLGIDLLTDDVCVVEAAREYLPWAVGVPLCGVMAFVYDGVFIGLTRTRKMLAAMAVATAAYFGVYFAACPIMGNHGLWLAFIVYLAVRSVVMHLLRLRRRSCGR